MIETIKEFFLTHEDLFQWLGSLSALAFVASLLLIPYCINRLPTDYFSNETYHKTYSALSHPFRNFFGILVILIGIAMLVLPGQGLICIALGIFLMRFPQKYAIMRRIVLRPYILNSLNWIRTRGARQPFGA